MVLLVVPFVFLSTCYYQRAVPQNSFLLLASCALRLLPKVSFIYFKKLYRVFRIDLPQVQKNKNKNYLTTIFVCSNFLTLCRTAAITFFMLSDTKKRSHTHKRFSHYYAFYSCFSCPIESKQWCMLIIVNIEGVFYQLMYVPCCLQPHRTSRGCFANRQSHILFLLIFIILWDTSPSIHFMPKTTVINSDDTSTMINFVSMKYQTFQVFAEELT